MSPDREKQPRNTSFLRYSVLLAINLFLLTHAFDTSVARKIKRESKGYCQGCGKYVGPEKLIAAHIIHGEKNRDPANGRAFCQFCETEYHLQHADEPWSIGLKRSDNDAVTNGHVRNLPEEDQEFLISMYSDQWENLQKRLDR